MALFRPSGIKAFLFLCVNLISFPLTVLAEIELRQDSEKSLVIRLSGEHAAQFCDCLDESARGIVQKTFGRYVTIRCYENHAKLKMAQIEVKKDPESGGIFSPEELRIWAAKESASIGKALCVSEKKEVYRYRAIADSYEGRGTKDSWEDWEERVIYTKRLVVRDDLQGIRIEILCERLSQSSEFLCRLSIKH
jgi:hypothetical protein